MYPIIYLYHGCLFYSLGYNPLLLLILLLKSSQIWALGALSGWFLYLFHMSPFCAGFLKFIMSTSLLYDPKADQHIYSLLHN